MPKPQLIDLIQANGTLPGVTGYNVTNAIDVSHKSANLSPIDEFIANGVQINMLITGSPSPILANLVILGYVSAVESYIRAILRRLILIDSKAKKACETKLIMYGSAISNAKELLPDALFEIFSITAKKNVVTTLNNYLDLGISENNLPPDLSAILDQFEEVCELRHCIVHRFGKFSSKTAISFGLDDFSQHIEKPIKCDYATLQQFITICHNTVRITNNFLFQKIMSRMILDGNAKKLNPIWTWNSANDRPLFDKYFEVFYSKYGHPTPRLNKKNAYNKYHKYYLSL